MKRISTAAYKILSFILMVLFAHNANAMYGGELITTSNEILYKDLYKQTVRLIIEKYGNIHGYRILEKEFCTGTIVGMRTILTAEHCLRGLKRGNAYFYDENDNLIDKIPIEEASIKGTKNYGEGYVEAVSASIENNTVQITSWPTEKPADLALVKLFRKIPSRFEPVKMNLEINESDVKSNALIKVGFGRSEEGRPRKIGRFRLNQIKDGILIGRPQDSLDGALCGGDSGGGVIYFENGKPVVIGVISSAVGLQVNGETKQICKPFYQLELISLLSYNAEWIAKNLAEYEEGRD